jgi:transcriptional regulator with XRE-family HTH domain
MTTLKEMMASLPAKDRAAVNARAKVLIAEEMTLRKAREAAKHTQIKVAERMGVGQDSVSQLENREDMLVSSLRKYVKALGGTVHLMVSLKGQPAFELKKIGKSAARAPKSASRRRSSRAA